MIFVVFLCALHTPQHAGPSWF